MIKKLGWMKLMLLQALGLGLAVAAYFGFRCPAQGCPACRLVGR